MSVAAWLMRLLSALNRYETDEDEDDDDGDEEEEEEEEEEGGDGKEQPQPQPQDVVDAEGALHVLCSRHSLFTLC